MDILKLLNISNIIHILSDDYMKVISKYFIITAVPVLMIAMINCFFGYKLFKILVGIAGIFIGALLGIGSCIGFSLLTAKNMPSVWMLVIAALLGAVILGFVSYKLYKAGAFCMGFISGVILGVVIMKLIHKDEYIIAGVIGGLLMGLLAVDLYKHMIVILTSINGSLVSAACLSIIIKKDDPVFIIKLGVIMAILGIVFQYIVLFVTNKRKDEPEEDEDNEDTKKEKQIIKAKKKKEEKIQDKEQDKKENSKHRSDEKKILRKYANKKKDSYQSEFFLIEIFSHIAQSIKDFIINRLDNKYEDEGYDEDELIEDYNENEFIEENEDRVEENDIEDEIEKDRNKRAEKTKKWDNSKLQDDLRYHNVKMHSNNDIRKTSTSCTKMDSSTKPLFIIKENEELPKELSAIGKGLEQKLIDEITIPTFDLDDIEKKLEEELNYNMNAGNDDELEDLIIKQTIKNIDN